MTIWGSTLEEFRRQLGSRDPAPAGVSASAVSAAFALGLLIKVLDITRHRKSFHGDAAKYEEILNAAQEVSLHLVEFADADIAAFHDYLADPSTLRHAIDVPLRAAEAAADGLKLCDQAMPLINETLAPDLHAARVMLHAAIRAILGSVTSNLKHDSDPEFRAFIEARVAHLLG